MKMSVLNMSTASSPPRVSVTAGGRTSNSRSNTEQLSSRFTCSISTPWPLWPLWPLGAALRVRLSLADMVHLGVGSTEQQDQDHSNCNLLTFYK